MTGPDYSLKGDRPHACPVPWGDGSGDGAHDAVVPLERSLEMVRALRGRGGAVREVIYPGAGNGDAVERAYAPGSELYAWFTVLLAASR